MLSNCVGCTDRQTDRQTDRTDRQTDRQDRQTDRQTGRQTDRQTGRQTDRQTDRHWCIMYVTAHLQRNRIAKLLWVHTVERQTTVIWLRLQAQPRPLGMQPHSGVLPADLQANE